MILPLSDSLGKLGRLGFRRWYERQLIEAHLWFAACFAAIVVCAAAFELLLDRHSASETLLDALLVAVCAFGAWFAWRRYAKTMAFAETIGGQANCPRCQHHGFRLLLTSTNSPTMLADEYSSDGSSLVASCPKCASKWLVRR